jgi:hypothetical protein
MNRDERLKTHYLVFSRIGGKLFASPAPIETLPLGPDYALNMSKLNQKRTEFFQQIKADLTKLDD